MKLTGMHEPISGNDDVVVITSWPLLQYTIADELIHSRQFHRFVWMKNYQRNTTGDFSITPIVEQ